MSSDDIYVWICECVSICKGCVCVCVIILEDQKEWEGMYHGPRDIDKSMSILQCSFEAHMLLIMIL